MHSAMMVRWCTLCLIASAACCRADVFVTYESDGSPSYSTTWVPGSRALGLANTTSHPAPTQASQTKKLNELEPIINSAATRYAVDPALVKAVIDVESRFNNLAVSPQGAKGIMQLMPAVQQQYGISNAADPIQNIDAGTRHLRALLDQYNGNLALVLAAYNAGARRVGESGKRIPSNRETMNYVPTVLARYAFYRHQGGN